ncbi:hypothetical protein [Actinomadura coerulea]|uniref:hypothetical protein n=1 Tax=Actinomadura coerulea TaxID=46159 RepID=UPI0034460E32
MPECRILVLPLGSTPPEEPPQPIGPSWPVEPAAATPTPGGPQDPNPDPGRLPRAPFPGDNNPPRPTNPGREAGAGMRVLVAA